MDQRPPQLLSIDPQQPDADIISETVDALRRGELIVMPTETVYGLAADMRVPGALEKIYEAKHRPADKAIALLAASADDVRASGAEWTTWAQKLATQFWPGPLTMVLRQGSEWTGYRVPANNVALEILRKMRTLLAVTSANLSGQPPAVTAMDAAQALGTSVSIVLDAGPARGKVPSTVVKVDGDRVDFLRDGALSRAEIEAVLRS